MRAIRVIAIGVAMVVGVAEGLFTNTRRILRGIEASGGVVGPAGSVPDGDVQVYDLVRAHNEWDRARIRAWRRHNAIQAVPSTGRKLRGIELIEGSGGDAA